MRRDFLKLAIVLGTRPEAIKLSPIIMAARSRKEVQVTVVNVGQQGRMVAATLRALGIDAQFSLNLMRPRQEPTEVLARVLGCLPKIIHEINPDIVMVQGDTSTALAGALVAYHLHYAVAHVEAGLRTADIYSPFPEEMNRRLISRLASYHFAPTVRAKEQLIQEGVPERSILVSGNPIVDALYTFLPNASPPALLARESFVWDQSWPVVLFTCHRRESHGEKVRVICKAVRDITRKLPNVHVICPVHPNPAVAQDVLEILGRHPRIFLLAPLAYPNFLWILRRANIVLTDSGGIQEEAAILGKRIILLRDTTERQEGVDVGITKLVGSDPGLIIEEVVAALSNAKVDDLEYSRNLYGDGYASHRILQFLMTSSD